MSVSVRRVEAQRAAREVDVRPEAVPVLQMRGIEKRFGGVHALKGVDLTLQAGQVIALIGENGAGKSTLMKILGGILAPDAGEILIDGKAVVMRSASDAIRYGISFIHQELNVLDNLDVAGNVFLGREPVRGGFLRLLDRKRMQEETEEHLRRLGVGIRSTTPLSELTIAQRQMVEIAKALSLKARILIMDEPTSSLTLQETERLLEVVLELRRQGVAIIYISHRLNEVERIADRVIVLRDGERVGVLERDEITHERMVRMMVGRELENYYQHPRVKIEPGYFVVKDLRTARYPRERVSFEIGKGEILGLAGLVGAGRTDVAEAIFGIGAAQDGVRVRLAGEEIAIRSPRDAIRHGIYLVPEDRRRTGLILEATIRENVTLPAVERYARAGLIALARERHSATEICRRLNVKAPSVETWVSALSGGNQQKVVLAKWLALEPRVLIFDEPTRGIDVGAKAEIYELMRQLAESGVAILMISSEMEEILNVSDRVAVMHEGRLMGVLGRDECCEEAIMRLAVGQAN
ncbi:MAG: sugar ABC transporter ATP-binding protein [Pyrinomonas methylaliphatogenes]|jgi:ribose transport system ATP-binding protein|uniref:ABC-type sugar transport system, ATPase component n=2 Tax=Pyrinomonas methylaliphatogenes TaxID=454194 RepID=A0A0B6WXD4_9BACT|nr:sugar ABC transporter ATP-binding protein [Pyrinomonas methylaliphatogenes]MBX5479341.1 sugar ABC transporter ATP-binding protein [Pyrinomonas methylaliphatogenes]CDM64825.1 ABC-type sugar transport system, ATPase component [Pyrinomonas methylaliphatogenes]